MNKVRNGKRTGFSLMELLAVVTILGIIAAIIVPRVTVSSDTAKAKVNAHNKATINAAVERYYIENALAGERSFGHRRPTPTTFRMACQSTVTSGGYSLNATTHQLN
jgi:prepilin-type N-terminal cleavage/methylation domain-containing protein